MCWPASRTFTVVETVADSGTARDSLMGTPPALGSPSQNRTRPRLGLLVSGIPSVSMVAVRVTPWPKVAVIGTAVTRVIVGAELTIWIRIEDVLELKLPLPR